MTPDEQFAALLGGSTPFLALAPMQEVTDGAFWSLIHRYGGADVYWTEYFRVHADSTPEKRILDSIKRNTTGRPVVAQLIGNDIPSLVRTAKALQQFPIAAIDLNLGCPAPIVYRKCAGGGLLREPQRVDAILGALRDAVRVKFTVKTRLGFASADEFDALLPIFARHALDALTVHARTVAQLYRLPVHYDRIRQASEAMPCPVIANGHVHDGAQAQSVLAQTGARGLMIGRAVIRSPWLFNQIRQQLRGEAVTLPTGRDVWGYIRALWDTQAGLDRPEKSQCERMKKFLNYLGEGVPAPFLHQIRRTQTASEFHGICAAFLDHDEPMALAPAEVSCATPTQGASMPPEHDRRTFITCLGGVAALAATSGAEGAQAPAQPAAAGPIDITWFDAFKGKHKQLFDLGTFDLSVDTPLRQLVTFLAAHKEVNRLEPPDDINAVVGISLRAFPMNAGDALWQKFGLGEHYNIKDPATGKPSVRNIFVDGPVAGPATVAALQARGVRFWQCNFSLAALAADLAAKSGGNAAGIRADLAAGLRPGVRLVPAHTWAVGFVQERGFTYMKL